MRKVINGKVYDTDTAKKIASYHLHTYNDFEYFYEILYRTPRGNYFFKYEGGPRSKYRKNEGIDGFVGSIGLKPIDPDDAFHWLLVHDEEELAMQVFDSIAGDTVTELTSHKYGWDDDDDDGDNVWLRRHTETIYRTRHGKYFLYYKGAVYSKYSKLWDSVYCNGGILDDDDLVYGIRKLTRKDAFEWLRKHDKDELAIELFPTWSRRPEAATLMRPAAYNL